MNTRNLVLCGIVVLAAVARLLPHPPNFTPIEAMALFGAAHFRSRWAAFMIPLTAMFLSDAMLQMLTRLGLLNGWMAFGGGFYEGQWVIYVSFALITAIGFLLRKNRTALKIAWCSVAGSVLFFVLTNLAVWVTGVEYPHNFKGLVECYVMAIPFFRWTISGDLIFAAILFGGFALAEKRYPALQPSTV